MTRVLIVGAGPAGIRAAGTLVQAGLHPVVVDEAARAGGQVYRRPPEGFRRSARMLYGSEAAKATALHRDFDQMVARGQVTHLPGRSVVAFGEGVAHVLGAHREEIPFDRLILATGATDRLAPVDGWQQGGVYSLGAAQIALKAQGVALGRRMVLAGSGPLLTLVAAQLLKAGAGVAAVLDTAPKRVQLRGGVQMALARPLVTARGLALRARLGARYHAGVRLIRVEGYDGPQAMLWRDSKGRERRTACDAVALGWHLRADPTLAELAGAQMHWDAVFHQWLPQTDALGRVREGLYLAGDGCACSGPMARSWRGGWRRSPACGTSVWTLRILRLTNVNCPAWGALPVAWHAPSRGPPRRCARCLTTPCCAAAKASQLAICAQRCHCRDRKRTAPSRCPVSVWAAAKAATASLPGPR